MAITVPVALDEMKADTFATPVASVINALMYPTWRALALGAGVTVWAGLTPAVSLAGRLCAFTGTMGVPASSPINMVLFSFPSGITFALNRNLLVISQQGPLPVWIDSTTNQARLGAAFPGGGWIGIDGHYQYIS